MSKYSKEYTPDEFQPAQVHNRRVTPHSSILSQKNYQYEVEMTDYPTISCRFDFNPQFQEKSVCEQNHAEWCPRWQPCGSIRLSGSSLLLGKAHRPAFFPMLGPDEAHIHIEKSEKTCFSEHFVEKDSPSHARRAILWFLYLGNYESFWGVKSS